MDITNFINIHPLLFYSIVCIVSLVILAKSSDLLVYGISNYARKLGISDYIIGFIVISIGTALPELVSSINGALIGQGAIVFGVVFGSNLFKIPLLGIIILIAKKIKNRGNFLGNAPVFTFALTMLPVFLVRDGILSRDDGLILLVAFIVYLLRLWKGEGEIGKLKMNIKLKDIYKDGLVFIGALIALLLSARWLVSSSIEISNMLKIPPYIIGLIVIGVGASTPELMVQLRSVLKKHENIAYGNVLGSLVANSTFVLGIVALISPVVIAEKVIFITYMFMAVGTLYVLYAIGRKEVGFNEGLIMIILYLVYLAAEWMF